MISQHFKGQRDLLNGWHVCGEEIVSSVFSGNAKAEVGICLRRPLDFALVSGSHSSSLAQVNQTLGIDRVLVFEVADGPPVQDKEPSAPPTPRGIYMYMLRLKSIHAHLDPGSACVNCLYSCHILYLWHTFLMRHTANF